MSLLVVEMDEATRQQVQIMFAVLDHDVTIHLFVKDHECLYCGDTASLVKLIADLSDKIRIEKHTDPIGTGKAAEMGIIAHPTAVLHGKGEYKVKFMGIPAGHEFGALVAGIVAVSTGSVPLSADIIADIKEIDRPVNIKVFTTPPLTHAVLSRPTLASTYTSSRHLEFSGRKGTSKSWITQIEDVRRN